VAVRLLDDQRPANVIPLRRKHEDLLEPAALDVPEPAQLYYLIVLAFLLHTPSGHQPRCVCCGHSWPCHQVRLAFRLREGF
jgi:hypothetical protein